MHPIRFVLCTSAVLSGFVFAPTPVRADSKVSLKFASSVVSHPYHWDTQGAQFDIVADPVACSDSVSVHLNDGTGWTDLTATRLDGDGIAPSLYRAHHTINYTSHDLQFAIRCGTGSNVTWDDNGGRGYSLAASAGGFLTSGNVHNAGFEPVYTTGPGTTYSGRLVLRNIAYAKQVKITYSTDNWRTVRESYATYGGPTWGYASATPNPNSFGFEQWYFTIDIGTASTVDYAVSYSVAGSTYWDNNFSRNYRTTINRPSPVRFE